MFGATKEDQSDASSTQKEGIIGHGNISGSLGRRGGGAGWQRENENMIVGRMSEDFRYRQNKNTCWSSRCGDKRDPMSQDNDGCCAS